MHLVSSSGHRVIARQLVPDDEAAIAAQLEAWIADPAIACIVSSGGTGITGRDLTPEAFRRVLTKEMPGFGEAFRALSQTTVGLSAMCSRALGGVAGGTYLFALPGSKAAVADAWTRILAPMFDDCQPGSTFISLLPRLSET